MDLEVQVVYGYARTVLSRIQVAGAIVMFVGCHWADSTFLGEEGATTEDKEVICTKLDV